MKKNPIYVEIEFSNTFFFCCARLVQLRIAQQEQNEGQSSYLLGNQ